MRKVLSNTMASTVHKWHWSFVFLIYVFICVFIYETSDASFGEYLWLFLFTTSVLSTNPIMVESYSRIMIPTLLKLGSITKLRSLSYFTLYSHLI